MNKCFLFFTLFTLIVTTLLNGEQLRIVSLGPYITENLVLLELEEHIVGLTIHDRDEIKKGREIIGTLLAPNIEKIVSLQPDIVIGSKEGNREEHIRKLQNLGIKTLTLGHLYTFEDICKNFTLLAETLNRKERAEEILKEVKTRLEKVKKQVAQQEKKKNVFFILGFRPLFTTGRRTYINEVIKYSGGVNIFGNINKRWFSCNIEEVIRKNPDVIIFLAMEEELKLLWKKLKDTQAVRNKQIYSIKEVTVIGSPTPLSFVETVEDIYKMLYPE